MRHRQAALGATLAWPAVCYASDASGLFVILFGVPSLLLSVVFAAVSLKAPRGGAVLCTHVAGLHPADHLLGGQCRLHG